VIPLASASAAISQTGVDAVVNPCVNHCALPLS
jgi:hypothetical protein